MLIYIFVTLIGILRDKTDQYLLSHFRELLPPFSLQCLQNTTALRVYVYMTTIHCDD